MKFKGLSLHIGVNAVSAKHYQGWDGILHAAENDARVYEAIAQKAGFKSTLLCTKQCTTKAVLQWLQKAAGALVKGDLLFVSYSGHGGSIIDLNQDEPDGFDETWCLYDRQLLDDELYAAFARFRKGVRILVFSDSCHSGTVAKAVVEDKARENQQEDPATYRKSRLAPLPALYRTFMANQELYAGLQKEVAGEAKEIAAYVLQFGACQDNEQSFEAWGNGLFTSKLRQVLEGPVSSYLELFEKIKKDFSSEQNPNLFHYGNTAFDFIKQVPFAIDGTPAKPLFEPPAQEKKSEKGQLIIERPDGGRGRRAGKAGSPLPPVPRDGVQPGQGRFELREADAASATEWDAAYRVVLEGNASFAEPDLASPYLRRETGRANVSEDAYLKNWPRPAAGENEFIWHLDDAHSQLRQACNKVLAERPGARVRIGHIDTGYVEDHPALPRQLMRDWGVSFVKKEYGKNKGIDKLGTGSVAEQDGHGTATMIILAGNKAPVDGDYPGKAVDAGAVPFAEVVPIRICETVFNSFNANDVAEGIDYAVNYGCEVITMSMAGYPTRRVAEAVNRAYENGVIVVTAAGNSFTSGIAKLSPRAVLYPARFSRVIAATGACCNGEPYDLDANSWYRSRMAGGEEMQGNWGPQSAMATALAAYTPNLAWALVGKDRKHAFTRTGGGTSSATPQVAAAAALWVAYNRDRIEAAGMSKSWKMVEACRAALFGSADRSYPAYRKYYGNGVVRALAALNAFDFSTVNQLRPSEKAHIGLTGLGAFVSGWMRSRAATSGTAPAPDVAAHENIQEMLSLELLQLMYRDPVLMPYAEALDLEKDDTAAFFANASTRRAFATAVLKSPYASAFLKDCVRKEAE